MKKLTSSILAASILLTSVSSAVSCNGNKTENKDKENKNNDSLQKYDLDLELSLYTFMPFGISTANYINILQLNENKFKQALVKKVNLNLDDIKLHNFQVSAVYDNEDKKTNLYQNYDLYGNSSEVITHKSALYVEMTQLEEISQ